MRWIWALMLMVGMPSGFAGQTPAGSAVAVAAGTKLELAVTRAVWAKTAKPGDVLYAQTLFPVVAGEGMAVPAGSYVEGRIENLTKPTRRSGRAEFHLRFTKIILADGYVVLLPDALTDVVVQVSSGSDILLDNGTQIEMTLGEPLSLDARRVAAAVALARAPVPGQFNRASLCRPTAGTPGTPGSPDTVIPGSPGTPATVIPGANGMPDTVIPGMPATPSTTIPGSPGTPGTPGISCPAPPIVISSRLEKQGPGNRN